jgi:outer membrane protein TolC
MPPIVEDYAAAPVSGAGRPAQVAELKPRDTGTGTGTGTAATTGTGGGVQGKINNAAARVSVAQYLDLFGLLSAARGVQNDVRDFYRLDIERLQNETALAAKNLFFNVLLTRSVVDTEQEQVRYAQENVRITTERLRQGIVSRFDVLTAQTALSTAQQQLISAQDNSALAEANLAYLLGTDPDQPLSLQTPPLPPLTQTVNLKQSTQTALAHRPEIRQANANIEEARRLVRLAGSTLLPTVSLVASGDQTTTASITSPKSYGTISAQVSVPFDDGGATRSRERSARIDVQTQALTLEELKLNVSLEVRQATLNIRNAQAQVGAAQTGVIQAQESVRLAYLRYQGGLGTFLDVLNALAELAATRNNLSSAQYFYQISLAQLVRALGGR